MDATHFMTERALPASPADGEEILVWRLWETFPQEYVFRYVGGSECWILYVLGGSIARTPSEWVATFASPLDWNWNEIFPSEIAALEAAPARILEKVAALDARRSELMERMTAVADRLATLYAEAK